MQERWPRRDLRFLCQLKSPLSPPSGRKKSINFRLLGVYIVAQDEPND